MKHAYFYPVFVFITVGLSFLVCKTTEPGSVYGIVTDQKSGQPVGGVEVVVGKYSWETVTNDSGYYLLSDINRKDYMIFYICPEYDTAEVEVTEMKEGVVYQIDVALIPESSN